MILRWEEPDPLQHEIEIVWLEDIDRFDYVRETEETSAHFRQRPNADWSEPGRMVGYSVLAPNAPNNGRPARFTRRRFWVKDYDRSEDPNGGYSTGCPVEAVDPRTVAPGVRGRITERARG